MYVTIFFCVFTVVFAATAKPVIDIFSVSNVTIKKFGKRSAKLSDIIFPEENYLFPSSEALPRLKGPPTCADGDTYCEHFVDYPHNEVQNILQEFPVDKVLFGMDTVPEMATRDGDVNSFLCQSTVKTIFPKVGRNSQNDWRIIINQGKKEGYIQGVVIETCSGRGKKCDLMGGVADYVTSCKQKYIYRRLLSLGDNGKPLQDTFMLPSACCCSYKRSFDFLSRMGK